MKYLISSKEIYRVGSEAEAVKLIEDAKSDNHFILSKYENQFKERKQKGEVVDSYWKVTLTKNFTDEKEPMFQTEVTYENGMESAF
jgi:hypothetical protein